jgi:hypothetical protein
MFQQTLNIKGLATYSHHEIEERASQFLRCRPGIEKDVLPVKIEVLADTGDIRLGRPLPLLLSKYSVEGCVCKRTRSGELVIHVDKDIADGRDRARYLAVIGEELSHIELHRVFLYEIKSAKDFAEFQQCDEWSMLERDAKLFSAAIRMPIWHVLNKVEPIYEQVVAQHGFGSPHETFKLVRNKMAELFCVLPLEMNGRLCDWPCELDGRILVSAHQRQLKLLPPEKSMMTGARRQRVMEFD